MSTIEQSDAEEAMSEWLQSAGVENAFTIGPALVAIGFTSTMSLPAPKRRFENGSFSDALNWLEALVSSVSLVCAIEESISRVSDLVMAVKKFAYDEKSPRPRNSTCTTACKARSPFSATSCASSRSQVEKRFAASRPHSYPRLRAEPGVDQPDRQRRGRLAREREDQDRHLD
jgi:hypothetical protein